MEEPIPNRNSDATFSTVTCPRTGTVQADIVQVPLGSIDATRLPALEFFVSYHELEIHYFHDHDFINLQGSTNGIFAWVSGPMIRTRSRLFKDGHATQELFLCRRAMGLNSPICEKSAVLPSPTVMDILSAANIHGAPATAESLKDIEPMLLGAGFRPRLMVQGTTRSFNTPPIGYIVRSIYYELDADNHIITGYLPPQLEVSTSDPASDDLALEIRRLGIIPSSILHGSDAERILAHAPRHGTRIAVSRHRKPASTPQ